jgi:hypothetical protein
MMSFLKGERGGLLKKHWSLVLEKRDSRNLFAHEPLGKWSCRHVGNFLAVEQNFGSRWTEFLV